MNVKTYSDLSQDVKTNQFRYCLNDEVLDFLFCWMKRNEDLIVVQASEIVHTIVTKAVQRFYLVDCKNSKNANQVQSIKTSHLYLSTHLDLLTRKFVLFIVNEDQQHWRGWTAINPWVKISRSHCECAKFYADNQKVAFEDYDGIVNVFLSCDGLNSKGQHDADSVIWFLNIASA